MRESFLNTYMSIRFQYANTSLNLCIFCIYGTNWTIFRLDSTEISNIDGYKEWHARKKVCMNTCRSSQFKQLYIELLNKTKNLKKRI